MIILQIAVFLFFAGNLVFLTKADFSMQIWNDIYYIYDATKDLLFMWAIKNLISEKFKWIIKPVLYYQICKVLWEIINPFTDIEINHPKAVTVFFIIIVTGGAMLLLKDLVQRWKQN